MNAGTGVSRTLKDVAAAVIKALGPGEIEFIPFPTELEGRYQPFTEADTTALRRLGWSEAFTPLEPGVRETLQGWTLEEPSVEGV